MQSYENRELEMKRDPTTASRDTKSCEEVVLNMRNTVQY